MTQQAGEMDFVGGEQKAEEKIDSLVEQQSLTGKILVAVDDMFFAAKILGAAQRIGREIERVKTKEELTESVSNHTPTLLIIDLNSVQLQALEVIETFKSNPTLAVIPILGFLSHVQVELKRRAEQLGCDYVIPRSAFSQTLVEILSGNLPKPSAKNH